MSPALVYFTKSPPQGAMTQVKCAAAPGFGPEMQGQFLSDCHVEGPSSLGGDAKLAARLWDLSEKLTGGGFDPSAKV